MKSIQDFLNEDAVQISCLLTDFAIAIHANKSEEDQISSNDYIEAAASYLNAKKIAIEGYFLAEKEIRPFLNTERNNYSKEIIIDKIITFVLFSKIAVDNLVCLVYVFLNGKLPGNQDHYPDISRRMINNSKIDKLFFKLTSEEWFKELKMIRDKLIHKGYTVYPLHEQIHTTQRNFKINLSKRHLRTHTVLFKEGEELIKDSKGIGFSIVLNNVEPINMDLIANGFFNRIPNYEKFLFDILDEILGLNDLSSSFKMIYRFNDLIKFSLD